MNHRIRVALLVLGSFVVGGAAAQTTTGSNTSIALPQPPRPIQPVATTAGTDSTFTVTVVTTTPATSTVSILVTRKP